MANDWIKMRADLPEDPAVFKLAALTKMDRLSVVGRLYAFWAWADKHAVDGRVDGATSQVVDDITRHDGFADALVSVRWLEIGDDHILLPKHDRHNGESAKERSLKNARQARWRLGKGKGASTDVDDASSTDASTREEKRRDTSSSLRSEDGPPPRKRAEPPQPVAKPAEVAQQTWDDWLTLRKAKKAPVTQTVVDSATREAGKAGMALDAFLQVWCMRGSQGLQADWLQPHERQVPSRVPPESAYARKMRETAEGLAPGIARRRPSPPAPTPLTVDMETTDVPAIARH